MPDESWRGRNEGEANTDMDTSKGKRKTKVVRMWENMGRREGRRRRRGYKTCIERKYDSCQWKMKPLPLLYFHVVL